MTREEAIKTLKTDGCYECSVGCSSPYHCGNDSCDLKEAIRMGIESLGKTVCGEWEECEIVQERGDEPIIDEWQSARCSVCGKYHTTPYMYYFDHFNYCPNCGAKMERREDGKIH